MNIFKQNDFKNLITMLSLPELGYFFLSRLGTWDIIINMKINHKNIHFPLIL